MAETKHDAVWAWLKGCPYIKDLFFNFSQVQNGGTALSPLTAYNDTVVAEYTGGASLRQYDFTLIRFEACGFEPNERCNLEVLCDVERIASWADEQAAQGKLPAFPEGYTITGLEVLPSNTGYLAGMDGESAKYMLQFRIEYLKGGRGVPPLKSPCAPQKARRQNL